jgi:hypothetical protein
VKTYKRGTSANDCTRLQEQLRRHVPQDQEIPHELLLLARGAEREVVGYLYPHTHKEAEYLPLLPSEAAQNATTQANTTKNTAKSFIIVSLVLFFFFLSLTN